MRARGEGRTDWARLDAMTEADIERAIADDPDWRDLEVDWTKAVRVPARKSLISMRLDPDILAWFRGQGRGYQTRINSVLRAYMNAQGKKTRRRAG